MVNPNHPVWLNTPINGVFDDLYQQNRVVINYCHGEEGEEENFEFQERHFQKIKTAANKFKIVEVFD